MKTEDYEIEARLTSDDFDDGFITYRSVIYTVVVYNNDEEASLNRVVQ